MKYLQNHTIAATISTSWLVHKLGSPQVGNPQLGCLRVVQLPGLYPGLAPAETTVFNNVIKGFIVFTLFIYFAIMKQILPTIKHFVNKHNVEYLSYSYLLVVSVKCCAIHTKPRYLSSLTTWRYQYHTRGAFSCAGACRRPEGVVFIVSRLPAPAGDYGSSLPCRQDGGAHRFKNAKRLLFPLSA